MGNCHYCFNCGRCRGEMPDAFTIPLCIVCGHNNDEDAQVCAVCGSSLVLGGDTMALQPGNSATSMRKGKAMADEKYDAEHAMDREQMNETGYVITAAPVSSDDNSFLDGLDGLPPIAPPGA